MAVEIKEEIEIKLKREKEEEEEENGDEDEDEFLVPRKRLRTDQIKGLHLMTSL